MRGLGVQFGVRRSLLFGRMRGAVGVMRWGGDGTKRQTLPSEASMGLTGHSRTEARKQNEAGLSRVPEKVEDECGLWEERGSVVEQLERSVLGLSKKDGSVWGPSRFPHEARVWAASRRTIAFPGSPPSLPLPSPILESLSCQVSMPI